MIEEQKAYIEELESALVDLLSSSRYWEDVYMGMEFHFSCLNESDYKNRCIKIAELYNKVKEKREE